jgi:hypothetical protein
MASAAVAAGKMIVKVPEVEVLAPPKSNTHTVGLVKPKPEVGVVL